jgi:hypothetical protein
MIYFGENGWIHSNAEERKSNYLVVFCREMLVYNLSPNKYGMKKTWAKTSRPWRALSLLPGKIAL